MQKDTYTNVCKRVISAWTGWLDKIYKRMKTSINLWFYTHHWINFRDLASFRTEYNTASQSNRERTKKKISPPPKKKSERRKTTYQSKSSWAEKKLQQSNEQTKEIDLIIWKHNPKQRQKSNQNKDIEKERTREKSTARIDNKSSLKKFQSKK